MKRIFFTFAIIITCVILSYVFKQLTSLISLDIPILSLKVILVIISLLMFLNLIMTFRDFKRKSMNNQILFLISGLNLIAFVLSVVVAIGVILHQYINNNATKYRMTLQRDFDTEIIYGASFNLIMLQENRPLAKNL